MKKIEEMSLVELAEQMKYHADQLAKLVKENVPEVKEPQILREKVIQILEKNRGGFTSYEDWKNNTSQQVVDVCIAEVLEAYDEWWGNGVSPIGLRQAIKALGEEK